MNTLTPVKPERHLASFDKSAREVMTTNPISINQSAKIADASEFLTNHGISAAPSMKSWSRAWPARSQPTSIGPSPDHPMWRHDGERRGGPRGVHDAAGRSPRFHGRAYQCLELA